MSLKEGSEFGVRLDEQFAWTPASTAGGARYGDPVNRLGSAPKMPPLSRAPAKSVTTAGIGVLLDDREVLFGRTLPVRVGGTLLVPVVPVLKTAGRLYTYNPKSRLLNVAGTRGAVKTTVGSSVAMMGAKRVRLSAPARFIKGTLYVPVQVLELSLGRRAEWDASSQTLLLASDASVDRYQLRDQRL